MDAQKWQKIKIILEEALEITPGTRRFAYLNTACADDKSLRHEIESLLDFEDATEMNLLERGAFSSIIEENATIRKNEISVGARIGNYKVIEKLGAGGMGTVFLAERADGAFRQKVAIKLIKRGMDSEEILRRFFNERQILASLEHSNIAHLIDGGTTDDGLPYFVMEYVEGVPIIQHATDENLGIEARLNLFRKVCAAVSYAHSNLVIHRDLKPSNILVARDGNVKLLDFGIAKILKTDTSDSETVAATQNFIFTPEYASPEQMRGEKLTTATDVYSLGVILYELLTGNRPYKTDGQNVSELIRAVCETEPERPSSVISRPSSPEQHKTSENNQQKTQRTKLAALRGDLDNIILKALRKESTRRYLSVEQLSEDIRRHLEGLPVMASRDTWNYRASKFVRRNRTGVATAGLVLLALLVGLGTTLYQAKAAQHERAKAERRFNDVRQLANSFMFEINEKIIDSPVKARELLVQRAVEYLDKLASEAGEDIELQSELSVAYGKIGDIQSEVFKPTFGTTSEALVSHQKALSLREKIFAAEPTGARGADVAASLQRIGDIFLSSGKISESGQSYRAAIGILEPLFVAEPQNNRVKSVLAAGLARLGQIIVRSGSLNEALEHYKKSLNLFENLAAQEPNNIKARRNVGITLSYIGFVNMEMGKTPEAIENYRKWLEIEKELYARDETNMQSRSFLSTAHIWFGVALSEQGEMRNAVTHLNEGIKIQEAIFAADKENLGEEYSLADCYLEFGKAAARNKMADESIANLEKSIKIYQKVWRKDAQNLMARHRIANAQRFLADSLLLKNDLKRASENYEQSLIAFKELVAADPANIDWQQDLAMNYTRIGEMALKKNYSSVASTNFEAALPIFEKLATNSPENVKRRREVETVKSYLAQVKR